MLFKQMYRWMEKCRRSMGTNGGDDCVRGGCYREGRIVY